MPSNRTQTLSPIPPSATPLPPSISKTAFAQRRRRNRERALHSHNIELHHPATLHNVTVSVPHTRLSSPSPPGSPSPHPSLSTRALGQPRRRARERAARSHHIDLDCQHELHVPTPPARRAYVEPANVVTFGRMNVQCLFCGAFHWLHERLKASSTTSPAFPRCCHHGAVSLDPLPDPPQQLKALFTTHSTVANEFRENIRQYNCALAFTSFLSKETHEDAISQQLHGCGNPVIPYTTLQERRCRRRNITLHVHNCTFMTLTTHCVIECSRMTISTVTPCDIFNTCFSTSTVTNLCYVTHLKSCRPFDCWTHVKVFSWDSHST